MSKCTKYLSVLVVLIFTRSCEWDTKEVSSWVGLCSGRVCKGMDTGCPVCAVGSGHGWLCWARGPDTQHCVTAGGGRVELGGCHARQRGIVCIETRSTPSVNHWKKTVVCLVTCHVTSGHMQFHNCRL